MLKKKAFFQGFIFAAGLFLSTISCANPTPITFWHSMSGQLGVVVNKLVNEFNASQSEYKVIPVYKGNYPQTLMALVAAFRAKQQPDIAQIFEVGTAIMTNPKGVIVPVYQLMNEAHIQLNANEFLPAIASYYSNSKGQLLALPFNSSTPVLFYNKDAFKKAKLNPNQPPKTWPKLATDSKQLLKSGFKCGFSTSWPSWIQLEAFSAWQNIAFATQNNGFSGINVKLEFNNPIVIHHIAMLSRWQKQKIFRYGGREDNATPLFLSGTCPMLMESSGDIADLVKDSSFKVGVAAIPYWPNVKAAPQNMLIGGAALWAISGHSKKVDRGIALFFKFLSEPKNQAYWQQATGYLPVTKAAFNLSKHQGFYKQHPWAMVPIEELLRKKPTPISKGIRLGAYPQIRLINEEALEAAFSGKESAKAALDNAVKRGNKALQQFKENIEG